MTSLSDRHLLGDVEFLDDAAPHAGPRADPAHPHTHVVEVLPAPTDHLPVEPHQEPHLLGAALPVLGGERVDRQVFDADFDSAAGDVDEHRFTHLVALGAVQAALGGPPTVAVHHDRDVVGHLVGRDLGRGGLRRVLRRAGELAVGVRWQRRGRRRATSTCRERWDSRQAPEAAVGSRPSASASASSPWATSCPNSDTRCSATVRSTRYTRSTSGNVRS